LSLKTRARKSAKSEFDAVTIGELPLFAVLAAY
jgi:hypothetical protein